MRHDFFNSGICRACGVAAETVAGAGECMSDDTHDWDITGEICKRCSATRVDAGNGITCHYQSPAKAADDFAVIARRLKEIEAERKPKEPEAVVDILSLHRGTGTTAWIIGPAEEADEIIVF